MASGKSITMKMDDLRIALREPLERAVRPRDRSLRGKARRKARKAAPKGWCPVGVHLVRAVDLDGLASCPVHRVGLE